MTTAEALLAMKIGCKVAPTKWDDFDAYYEIQGSSIYYVCTTLGFANSVCAVNKFIEEYEGMGWKLYDESGSPVSNEDRMQNQS
jgi:hypothetical protein